MPDKFTPEKRSQIMSRVKGTDTKPEKIVRKLLHSMGYRFRLHRKDLPGKPDIVLPKHKKVILVHGCFWHGHKGCPRSARPTSNPDFWNKKLDANIKRDQNKQSELQSLGWQVLVVWQCQLRDTVELQNTLLRFLNQQERSGTI